MTVCGDGVFKEAKSKNKVIREGRGPAEEEGIRSQTGPEGQPHEDSGRGQPSTSQGGRSQRNQPWKQCALGLPASRRVRK